MATYLRLFETESEYIDFLNSDEFVRPNLSYVVSDGDVKFHSEPMLEPQEYDVKLTYNATADNLKPFVLAPANMSRLAIDGVEVPFETPIIKTGTTEILKDECQISSTGIYMPEACFYPFRGANVTIKPKDSSITLHNVDELLIFAFFEGQYELFETIPISRTSIMSNFLSEQIFFDYNENQILIKNLLERAPMELYGQLITMGVKFTYVLSKGGVANFPDFEIVDTINTFEYTQGGYTYDEDIVFDSEGTHVVELNVLKQNLNGVISNTVTDVKLGKIEQILPFTFSACTNLPVIDDIRYADTCVIGAVQNSSSAYTVKDGTTWILSESLLSVPIKSITLPSSLTYIGPLFMATNSPSTLNIPGSVKTLLPYTFLNCKLIEVVLNEGLEQIMPDAFYYCVDIKHIHIPSTVFYIGDGAFTSTIYTEQITVDENNEWYNSNNNCNCIIETKTKKLIRACDSSIIPNDIEHVASYGFADCRTIKSIILPQSVKTIGDHAFYCCMDATTIELSQQITEIKDNTFDTCYDLISVTIPANVTSMGEDVFRNSGVKSITCLATVAPTLVEGTFEGMKSDGILYYPSGSDYSSWIAKLPSGWTSQEI